MRVLFEQSGVGTPELGPDVPAHDESGLSADDTGTALRDLHGGPCETPPPSCNEVFTQNLFLCNHYVL